MDDPRLRALELQQQALVQLVIQLEGSQRELLGELRAWRTEGRARHPASEALIALLRSIGEDPWARRIFAAMIAIICLSFLTVPEGSPLFPLFRIAEKWVSSEAGAAQK